MDSKLREFLTSIVNTAKYLLSDNPIERRIKDVDEWDGSASRWDTTEAYCNACLINLNEGDPADWTQANCKLPVREPGDSADTYVRQAVYAAAGGNGIQAVDAPEDAKMAAANKIIAAYDEMGETAPEAVYQMAGKEMSMDRAISFGNIWEQTYEMFEEMDMYDYWPIDMYTDNGQLYLLLAKDGHLYRQPLSIADDKVMLAGDAFEVVVNHEPMRTRTTINRQKDGKYRWLSISATSVLNRVGEIDSTILFDSFVAHIDETGDYPIRQFYHQGEKFRTGQADFVARDGNCLLTSGVFDDTELAKAEIKARQKEPDYWGESIGYLPTTAPELLEVERGINIPVYTTGILQEISTLPEKQAANLFTVTIQQEEVNRMLTGKKFDALVKLFGDDKEAAEKWLTENADELNRAIKENGLVTRDKDNDEQPATQPEMVEIDDAIIEAIVNRMSGSNMFADMQEQMKKITEALETLNANQGDIVTRLDTLQEDADNRFKRLERSKAEEIQEAVTNMPSVPQVRRYEYNPRQGKPGNGKIVTMADQASNLKSFY